MIELCEGSCVYAAQRMDSAGTILAGHFIFLNGWFQFFLFQVVSAVDCK
jgi:hypothetical protein